MKFSKVGFLNQKIGNLRSAACKKLSDGGGSVMGVKKAGFSNGWIAAVLLAFLILGGCAGKATIKYSSIARTGFQELKSYQWAKADGLYRQDPLLEANVQSLVDRDLEQKGLVKKTEKADLLIWTGYEYDPDSYSTLLRTLNLNISRADNNELVWRGTAAGTIRTDATSSDVKNAVEVILANFPKK
jgi:hypothetical protein